MAKEKKLDADTLAALEVAQMEQRQVVSQNQNNTDRDKMVSECFRMFGLIQAADLMTKTTIVYDLLWLKQVKDLKIYKDVPGIETWEGFCDRLGRSRQKIDKDLLNLNTFGKEFLDTVNSFKLGYRDLQKLRFAVTEGDVEIQKGSVKVDQKEIPLDSDHAEELQDAIELLIEEKEKMKTDLDKLKKNQDAIIKEETKGLQTERNALTREVQRLKKFDPEDKDPDTWSIEQIKEIKKAADMFEILCRKFIIDERLDGNIPAQAMVEGVMTEVELTFKDLRRSWDHAFNMFDDGE